MSNSVALKRTVNYLFLLKYSMWNGMPHGTLFSKDRIFITPHKFILIF